MGPPDGGMTFVARHGLRKSGASRAMLSEIEAQGIRILRVSFPDQHGVLRGKAIDVSQVEAALEDGVAITTTLFAKDTSHKTVFPVFSSGGGFGMREMEGAADVLMIPDPATFRILPWAPHTAGVLCDTYFSDGTPVPFDSRRILKRALDALAQAGFEYVCGLEIEFHVFRVSDPALRPEDAGQPGQVPSVTLLNTGYQYLTEARFDQIDPVVQLLREQLMSLGLPLRSYEVEFGPSQFEFTLSAMTGSLSADAMVLFRSAVKQICKRHGYHATFMCRPRIPQVMSSGWHLHQSLRDLRSGDNAFAADTADAPLSKVGMHFLGGLLAHARGGAAFCTPTINGYKRYRPFSLAPDRVLWGVDNRGAMLRVIGGPDGKASRIENRIGEPAANPYLYMACQIYAGLDGISRKLDPGPSSDSPYEVQAPPLPRTLGEAIQALRDDEYLVERFGKGFVEYFCHIKEAEVARFNLDVSEWEHREYFDLF